MRSGRGLLVAAVLVGCVGGPGVRVEGAQVQAPQTPFGAPDAGLRGGRNEERDPSYARMQEQASKTRNSERQKRLVTDTETLLRLATELKQDVDKTDKNTLSMDVIKKAEEIEKLAHSVKERMRG